MEWPKAKNYTRDDRCDVDLNTCQPVPGNFSFRQEWSLDACEEVECPEEGKSQALHDECCPEDESEESAMGPLRKFDNAVRGFLQTDVLGQEPASSHKRNLHPRVLSRSTQHILDSTVDYMTDEKGYWDFAKKLAQIEKHFTFEQALLAAEGAAAAAPPELAEEAALATAKDYTTTMDGDTKTITESDCVIEVVSFLGVTRPKEDPSYSC